MKGSTLTPIVIVVNLVAAVHTLMSFATPDTLEQSLRYQRGGASLQNASLDVSPRSIKTSVQGLSVECSKPGRFQKLIVSGPDSICK